MKKLRTDHDEMRALVERLNTLLDGEYSASISELAHERHLFSQLLRRHLADEDARLGKLFPGDPRVAHATAATRQIMQAYSDHVAHWTPERVRKEWSQYGGAVRRLYQIYEQQMAWEEQQIFDREPPTSR